MLRYVINNDNQFFQALRDFHQQYAYGNATTEDLKNVAEQASGLSLDTFFHQWVYMEGFPRYSAKWIQNGNQVTVRLSHTSTRPLSVPVFKLPVELRLSSPLGDTIVRVDNDQAVQMFTFSWSKPMDTMFIDPNDQIINQVVSIMKDPTLSAPVLQKKVIEIFPNPSATAWQLKYLPHNARLVLSDVTGKKLWEGVAVTDSMVIPSVHLAPGSYILSVSEKGKAPVTFSLLR
jgi:hypothetical protein